MKPKHIKALKQAIDEAESWRGSLTGNYGDPESIREEYQRLAEFDAKIQRMRDALKLIVQENEAMKKLLCNIGNPTIDWETEVARAVKELNK